MDHPIGPSHGDPMLRVYRFRLYPTRTQQDALGQTLRLLRQLYNAALEERREAYRKQHVSVTKATQERSLTEIKHDCPEYAGVHTHLLQDVTRRLDLAYQAFFRRIKAGQKPGFPRFKGRDRYNSFVFKDAGNGNGAAFVSGGCRVRLHGVGNVKVKIHREMEGMLKTIGVTLDGDGHWYALITRDIPLPEPLPATGREVGIDLGLHSFLATSDGEIVANPRPLESARLVVERAQRRVARRTKGSNRRRKARALLARAHSHVCNVRKDFHHKTARSLVERCDWIAVEDLNVKGLARGMLARPVNDAAWARFVTILAAKAEEAGRDLVRVDPRGTSQFCSACGVEVRKDLSVRVHRCHDCGYEVDRDVNAARNVLGLGRSLRRAAPARGDCSDPRSPYLAAGR
jgi:putative transposase